MVKSCIATVPAHVICFTLTRGPMSCQWIEPGGGITSTKLEPLPAEPVETITIHPRAIATPRGESPITITSGRHAVQRLVLQGAR